MDYTEGNLSSSPYIIEALPETTLTIASHQRSGSSYLIGLRDDFGPRNYNWATVGAVEYYLSEVIRLAGEVIDRNGGELVFVSPVRCSYRLYDSGGVLLYTSPVATVGCNFNLPDVSVPYRYKAEFPALEYTVFSQVELTMRPWRLSIDTEAAVPQQYKGRVAKIELDTASDLCFLRNYSTSDYYKPNVWGNDNQRLLTVSLCRYRSDAQIVTHIITVPGKNETAEPSQITELPKIAETAAAVEAAISAEAARKTEKRVKATQALRVKIPAVNPSTRGSPLRLVPDRAFGVDPVYAVAA